MQKRTSWTITLSVSAFRGYAASALSPKDGWIVTGGMTTDFKALDSQLMIESLGFVEMNFNESEKFIKGLKIESATIIFYIFSSSQR